MTRPFVDLVEVTVRAGRGGDGCTSFRRQAHEPRGGPDGGDGGQGGDVLLRADANVGTLVELNYASEIEAGDGDNGGPNRRRGADGEDRVVRVPPGTIIYRSDTGVKLGELLEDGDQQVVARGGDGGRGNRCFTNSQRQSPRFHEFGQQGERLPLRLELKLLAHVGIVGKPNAGKSTLLSALTAATPRVAEHPFTTTSPNLGVMFREYERLVLCDVPGLIEDAHLGAGLGFDFLRHADRTEILLHVVDLSASRPVQDYETIRHELTSYDDELAEKPVVIAANKMDRVDEEMLQLFKSEIQPPPGPVVGISATEGRGLTELKRVLWEQHEERVQAPPSDGSSKPPERVVKMEQKKPIRVFKAGDRYVLEGDEVEQLVRRFDLGNPDALSYVRDRLLSIGLHKKLEKAGCRPGDTVRVGGEEFEYTG